MLERITFFLLPYNKKNYWSRFMKQFFSASSIITLFFIMLSFPQETLYGASEGLLLWFQILLPTLLPFLILTNLLIHTNSIIYISQIIGPFFQKLFRVSKNGSFAVLSGFLCGYPVGAKVTADLVRTNKISTEEGKYLLSFCNNTSPAFISSYIVLQNLKDESLLLTTLFLLYLSPVLCSFLFRRFYHFNPVSSARLDHSDSNIHFSFEILDDSIMNAFETITQIGGYVILFSVFISLGKMTPFDMFLPILEITNGIPQILSQISNFYVSYVLVLALTSFGGLCAIAQTNTMLHDTKLSIVPYIIEKLITALVTSLVFFLYVLIILHPR